VLFYTLALFSKETALCLLPVYLVAEFALTRRISAWLHGLNLLTTAAYLAIKYPLLHFGAPHLLADWRACLDVPLCAAGFYFKALLLPVGAARVGLVADIRTLANAGLALALLALLALLYYLSRARPLFLVWATWALAFTGLYALLPLAAAWPPFVYSRYMAVPALALIWIAVQAAAGLKQPVRLLLAAAVLLVLLPTTWLRIQDYRDEVAYWQSSVTTTTPRAIFDYFLAAAYAGRGDIPAARVWLDRCQRLPMDRVTPTYVSLLAAQVAFQRAGYAQAAQWLGLPKAFFPPTMRAGAARLQSLIAATRAQARAALAAAAPRPEGDDDVQAILLLYLAGQPEEAWRRQQACAFTHHGDTGFYNRLGDMYLQRLHRPEEAVRCWRLSLGQAPNQPAIAARVREIAPYCLAADPRQN
jgi:hypothetical protein